MLQPQGSLCFKGILHARPTYGIHTFFFTIKYKKKQMYSNILILKTLNKRHLQLRWRNVLNVLLFKSLALIE